MLARLRPSKSVPSLPRRALQLTGRVLVATVALVGASAGWLFVTKEARAARKSLSELGLDRDR